MSSIAQSLEPSQQFIYVSRYSRWIEPLNRREVEWTETTKRYFDFLKAKLDGAVPKKIWALTESLVNQMGVMPSMRAVWGAGDALAKNNIIGYNCSYLPFIDLRAPVELFYILMCGTGVGFSIEKRYIEQIPAIPQQTGAGAGVHIVGDSREGWADSLDALFRALWDGKDLQFDYSKVRPRGTRLKTMGGRASGPEPLKKLHDFARAIILRAQGRKLNSEEWLDIGNVIGDVVVVGGVRRSSEITFSDLHDDLIRHAKDGAFPPHRYNSNNTAVYYSKPDSVTFMREWAALAASGRGERGFFNLAAVKKHVPSRRKWTDEFRTNPCVTADTMVMTNIGPRQVSDLIGRQFVAVVDGQEFLSTPMGFWNTGTKEVFVVSTNRGYSLKATSNHKILTIAGWKEVGQLVAGDSLVLNDHTDYNEIMDENFKEEFEAGWLLGEMVGDGGYAPNYKQGSYVRFWGPSAKEMGNRAVIAIQNFALRLEKNVRNDFSGTYNTRGIFTASHDVLNILAERFIAIHHKDILPSLECAPKDFVRGFLRGFFDADGTVANNPIKGSSVRLTQVSKSRLQAVQRMLLRFGIASSIYTNRKPAGMKLLPDGNGGQKLYPVQQLNELVIARDSIEKFALEIGFYEPNKAHALDQIVISRVRPAYKDRFETKVISVVSVGKQEVYDCSIPNKNAFDANGLIAHNCGEILLRPFQFCNLTEVVVRANDDFDDLIAKVKAAVWLGAMQSTLTDFPYIRPLFKKNCEEERLLGVSLTGQMDNPKLMTEEKLEILKKYAVKEAKKACEALKINMSVAITTGKPSGTVSQLVNSASGAHPRHAPYYIRRYRLSGTDPLFAMMRDQGVEFKPDNGQGPESVDKKRRDLVEKYGRTMSEAKLLIPNWDEKNVDTWVCSFPIKSPKNALTREDITALDQLNWYLKLRNKWCEHNQSITVYVKDHEWMTVGAWVYDHFDELVGVSFLPYDGGKYEQAPYEEITEEEYNKLAAVFPKIDYTQLSRYELEDGTNGAKELACSSGSCEIL